MTQEEEDHLLLVGICAGLFGLLVGVIIARIVYGNSVPDHCQRLFNKTLAEALKAGAEQYTHVTECTEQLSKLCPYSRPDCLSVPVQFPFAN